MQISKNIGDIGTRKILAKNREISWIFRRFWADDIPPGSYFQYIIILKLRKTDIFYSMPPMSVMDKYLIFFFASKARFVGKKLKMIKAMPSCHVNGRVIHV